MDEGIAAAGPGQPVHAIGRAIERHARKHGLGVVREFIGHGIGTEFHSGLQIPHYHDARASTILVPGMTFTIEPMLTLGDPACGMWNDNWTAVTLDGRRTAQFEHTVAVTREGYMAHKAVLADPANGIEVDDYEAHKSYAVVHNGTHDVCQSFCPLDPRDTLDGGAAYFLGPNATDLGAATFRGAAANEWQWEQKMSRISQLQASWLRSRPRSSMVTVTRSVEYIVVTPSAMRRTRWPRRGMWPEHFAQVSDHTPLSSEPS